MAIDIFKPKVSKVVKGIQGKAIFLYGGNGVGKTLNSSKAPKPFFISFEKGLGAINNVAYEDITSWSDFRATVKQLTSAATIAQAKEYYQTIIVDGVEGMGPLADAYIASANGAPSVAKGNSGYGLWKEFENELRDQIQKLTRSGYTIIFLGHIGYRDIPSLTPNDEGKYLQTKIYPKGEKRAIDVIMNECDLVGYIQAQPADINGNEVLSTVYFANNIAFQAKTRFEFMPRVLPEWTYDKLEQALAWAIAEKEKQSGTPAISLEQHMAEEKAEEEVAAAEEAIMPITTLIEKISLMVRSMKAKEGSLATYKEIVSSITTNPDFKVNKATEADREIVESIFVELTNRGYAVE